MDDTLEAAETRPTPTAAAASVAPYPGLRAFSAEESNLFFGRDHQTEELLVRLDSAHFLAVLGASGCGKSSLVRAGLISQLEAGFMPGAGAHWQVAELRPGDEPFHRLAEQLVKKGVVPRRDGESEDVQSAVLEARLQQGPLALGEVLAERTDSNPPNLLVLVDQFEEIFRFHHERDSDQADAFVALLLATVAACEAGEPWSRVYIALTMRSDFLGDCILFNGLTDAINRGLYVVPELQRDDLQLAIEGPAALTGTAIEPALVSHLLNESGARGDQLPLLQHALMRLWYQAKDDPKARDEHGAVCLCLDHYKRRLGSLGKALNDHADEMLLAVENDALVQAIFTAITGRQGHGRDTRRPTRIRDVTALAGPGRYWTDIVEVAEKFRAPTHNFLQPPQPEPLLEPTYLDIGHESLIRNWIKLAGWVRDEDELATELRRAVDAAKLARQARLEGKRPELWGPSGIERSRRWLSRDAVAVWAQRYVSPDDYEQAVAFIGASEEAVAMEAAERRNAKRRRVVAALGGVAAAVVGLSLWSYSLNRLGEQVDRMQLANKSLIEQAHEQQQLAERDKRKAETRIAQAESKELKLRSDTDRIEQEAARTEKELQRKVKQATAVIDRVVGKRLVSEASAKEDADYALAATMEGLRIAPTEAAMHELRRRQAVWPDQIRTPPTLAADLIKAHEDGTLILFRHGHRPLALTADLTPAETHYRQEWPHDATALHIALSSRPPRMLVHKPGDSGTNFVLEDMASKRPLRWFEKGVFKSVQLDATGRHLLTIDNEDRVLIRPVGDDSASNAWSPPIGKRKFRYGAFHPHQPWVLLGDAEGQLSAVNMREPHEEVRLAQTFLRREVRSLTPLGNGSMLAVFTSDKPGAPQSDYLEIWNWSDETGSPALRMERLIALRPQEVVRFGKDGIIGMGAAGEQSLRVFDARNGWEILNWSSASAGVLLRDFFIGPAGKLVSLWSDGLRRDFDLGRRQSLRSAPALPPDTEIKDGVFGPQSERVTFTVGPSAPSLTTRQAQRALDALAPDGLWASRGDGRNTVAIVDIRGQRIRNRVQLQGASTPSVTALDREARYVAIGHADGNVTVMDASNGNVQMQTRVNGGTRISSLTFSSRGTLLAWGDSQGGVGAIDWRSATQFTTPQRHGEAVRDVAISPDGSVIASGGDDNRLRLWNVVAPEASKAKGSANLPPYGLLAERTNDGQVPAPHDDWVMAIAFAPDGKSLVTGADDGEIRLWTLADGRFVKLPPMREGVRALVFSADGQRLVATSAMSSTRWMSVKGELLRELGGEFAGRAGGLRIDAEGRAIALSTERRLRTVTMTAEPQSLDLSQIDPPASQGVRSYMTDLSLAAASAETLPWPEPPRGVQITRMSANGEKLLTLDANKTLRVTDVGSGTTSFTSTLDQRMPTAIAIAPDGRRVAAGFENGTVSVFTLGVDRSVTKDKVHPGRITALCFSADGSQLASVAGSQVVQLSSADTLNPLRPLQHKNVVRDVMLLGGAGGLEWLTVESNRMSGWSREGTAVREWDTPSPVTAMAPNRDSSLLLTIESGSIRLYNLQLGSSTLTPQPLVGTVNRPATERPLRAAFSSDGRRVIALLASGAIRELPCQACLRRSELLDWGSGTARKLTPQELEAARRLVVD